MLGQAINWLIVAILGMMDPKVHYWMWRDNIPEQYIDHVTSVRRLEWGESAPYWNGSLWN